MYLIWKICRHLKCEINFSLRRREKVKVVLRHVASLPLDLSCEPAGVFLHLCHLNTETHEQTPLTRHSENLTTCTYFDNVSLLEADLVWF